MKDTVENLVRRELSPLNSKFEITYLFTYKLFSIPNHADLIIYIRCSASLNIQFTVLGYS